jgi:hypothetical protein
MSHVIYIRIWTAERALTRQGCAIKIARRRRQVAVFRAVVITGN